jgi:acyl-CoA synthetase (NDP forming)
MTEDSIDVIVVFIGMLKHFKDELIRDFEKAARKGLKPIATVWMDPPLGAMLSSKEKGIPVFEDPIRCANAVSMLVKYAESIRR